jgi:O-antigen ligase
MKSRLFNAYPKLDWLIITAIFMFPITFLAVRHGVHVSLFVLLLIAAHQFWRFGIKNIQFDYPQDLIILLIFSGLFLSVLISQISRGAIHFAAFDGPSRILFAGIVFIFIKQLNIPYIKILSITIPVGLVCIFLSLQMNPSLNWGGRYATYFVDPNTLGSQTFILGILSTLLTGWAWGRSRALSVLLATGGVIGLYISLGTGSRGAWLTAPFLLLLLLILRIGDISRAIETQKERLRLQALMIIMGIITIMAISLYLSDTLSVRIISGYVEVQNWFSGKDLEGSAGIRLSMWKFGLQFSSESFLFGYGEEKNMLQILQNSPLNIPANELAIGTMAYTGPHSDILSKLLTSGIFGLVAYLGLVFLPFMIFWQHRNEINPDKKMASRVGLYYITGIFIAGFSNEQLSLKYLCTFYGLMIATLLAQVLYKPSAAESARQPSVV